MWTSRKCFGKYGRSVCEVFRFERLNEHQEEEALQFVNLPTFFGKSVVFQAFSIVYSYVEPTREKNIGIVVSLLVNLIKDQVSHLTSLEIIT